MPPLCDLHNALLSLTNFPDWVFSMDVNTSSLNSLYRNETLPAVFSDLSNAMYLSDLERMLQTALSIDEWSALTQALSIQSISSAVKLSSYTTQDFTVNTKQNGSFSFRFSYISEKEVVGAFYYRELPDGLKQYLF